MHHRDVEVIRYLLFRCDFVFYVYFFYTLWQEIMQHLREICMGLVTPSVCMYVRVFSSVFFSSDLALIES